MEAPKAASAPAAEKLEKLDSVPEADRYALYIAPDGSMGVACEKGVCSLTPMEVQMMGTSFAGKAMLLHDCKSSMHALDQMDISIGHCIFDTALAAYDLNPSQSDYSVSKLATNFLGISVDDGDAAGCAEALWHLQPVMEDELAKNGMTALYFDMNFAETGVLTNLLSSGTLTAAVGGIAIAVGVLTFSKRVMMTVGGSIADLNQVEGFLVIISMALTILLMEKLMGIPVSTSQAVVGAVIGAGLVTSIKTKSLKNVNFKVFGRIGIAWVSSPTVAGLLTYLVAVCTQGYFAA
jgi:hypothetical protein